MTVKTLAIIFSIALAYFGATWFFYGSAHPCEILVVRQKDHHIKLAEKDHREDLESWKKLARKALPAKDYDRFVRNVEEYSNVSVREENLQRSVLVELRQKVKEMTPAQCARLAITWKSPSFAD